MFPSEHSIQLQQEHKPLFVLVPRRAVCLPRMAWSILQPTAPHGSFPTVLEANLKLAGRSLKAKFASGSLRELEHVRGASREHSAEQISKAALMPSELSGYRNQLMLLGCAGLLAQGEL